MNNVIKQMLEDLLEHMGDDNLCESQCVSYKVDNVKLTLTFNVEIEGEDND